MADAHKNFAYSLVATAPSPATSGTSLVVSSGDGAKFPTPPFNATIWPIGLQPTTSNAEIVRVTNISTDTLTITRTQESSSARSVIIGDQIAATITVKTLTDVESGGAPSYQTGIDATRDMSSGSGTLNIAHGLGKTPLKVNIMAHANTSNSMSVVCFGAYDGTHARVVGYGISINGGAGTAWDGQANEMIYLEDDSGTKRQEATISVDATNIILVFTKAGTPGSGTLRLLWEVEG